MIASEPKIMIGRIFLMLLGFLLIYLGSRNVLELLLMIPMGLGMSSINASVIFLEGGKMGTLFVAPLLSEASDLVNIMQVNWLQPIYTLTLSIGLIACPVFMGIGVLLDVGYVMARPFQSMFIALFAELGTIAVIPIAVALGPTDHGRRLHVSGAHLRRLSVPDQMADSKEAPGDRHVRRPKSNNQPITKTHLCRCSLFFSPFVGVAVRESGLEDFSVLSARLSFMVQPSSWD